MALTAVILTLNEAEHIVACIDSLRWADRILVFDSYSQDDTPALARAAGADVRQHAFANYAAQRFNFGFCQFFCRYSFGFFGFVVKDFGSGFL